MPGLQIKGRKWKVGSGTVPPDPQPGDGVITLTLTSSNGWTNPTVEFAELKYDKFRALNMQKDDGGDGDYRTVFRYLGLGQNFDGSVGAKPQFSDGCGKLLDYRYTFAVPTISFGSDVHVPGVNNTYSTWPEYAQIIKKGFGILHHGYDTHPARSHDIYINQKHIYNKLKEADPEVQFVFRGTVIPDTQEGYSVTSPAMGLIVVSSAFGLGAADDQEEQWVRWGVWKINPPENNKPNQETTQNLLLSRGHLGDDWSTGSNLTGEWEAWVSRLYNNFFGTGKFVMTVFSHGPGISQNSFNFFKDRMNYLHNYALSTNNTLVGQDNIWVGNTQEIVEYFLTKQGVVKSYQVDPSNPNKLIVALDTTFLPEEHRFKDMSLLVSGGTLTNVAQTNADEVTFNLSKGLVNVYKEKKVFADPALKQEPPYISSLIVRSSAPKVVEVTFSRGVYQTLYQAYSINSDYPNENNPGNPATSLEIVSPTLHKIHFQHDIPPNGTLEQKSFYYRMQKGDAIDANNPDVKVGSYIRTYGNTSMQFI